MRRSLVALSLVLSLVAPSFAAAAYTQPSEIFFAALKNEEGKPRNFAADVYFTMKENGEKMTVAGSFKGMGEGTTLENTKLSLQANFTVTMAADESDEGGPTGNSTYGTVSGGGEAMISAGKLYVRLSPMRALEGSDPTIARELITFNEQYANKWYASDAQTLQGANATSWNSSNDLWTSIAALTGNTSMSPAMVSEIATRVVNAVFTMETAQFKTGYAYTLSLKPRFMSEGLLAVYQVLAQVPELSVSTFDPQDPSILAMEKQFNDSVKLTVRVKVDTNNQDVFRFSRLYATIAIPEVNMSASMEATTEQRTEAVNVDVPENTEDLSNLLMPQTDEYPVFDEPTISLPTTTEPSVPSARLRTTRRPVSHSDNLPVTGNCPSDTVARIGDNRRGDCPITRYTQRSIRNRAQQLQSVSQ